jgi:hypothetical protein
VRLLKTQSNSFLLALTLLCAAYLVFQFFYTSYEILCVDDFLFAHRIYDFKHALPYRDFAPYKTVLGYYILWLPMMLSHGIIQPLLNTKHLIVVINTAVIFSASFYLRHYFSKIAILLTLLLLFCAEITLVYSTNIRVDLLGYWFCLISVLLLLENKNALAGLFIGLGFLTTQKVLWYIAASDAALGVYWLSVNFRKETLKNIIVFNAACVLTVASYILFWGVIDNFQTVLSSVFYEAYLMYHSDIYDSTRKLFWTITVHNNTLLFLLAPTTLLSLLIKPAEDEAYGKRVFILVYSAVILFGLIRFKQVFPYYMVALIPVFLLLYSAFFSWLLQLIRQSQSVLVVGKMGVWAAVILNLAILIYLVNLLSLANINLFIGLIPIIIGLTATGTPKNIYLAMRDARLEIIATIIFTGCVISLAQFINSSQLYNNHYQRTMLSLATNLLNEKNGGDYVAGIEFFYNKTQPIDGMRQLDALAMTYLYHPTEKYQKLMLASFYNSAVTKAQVLTELKKSQIKLYINNDRMRALPATIQEYLHSQYEHYWGSIYLYAPLTQAGSGQTEIKFAGKYLLEISGTAIQLDGRDIEPDSIFELTQGQHAYAAQTSFRLKLLPNTPLAHAQMNMAIDEWYRMF